MTRAERRRWVIRNRILAVLCMAAIIAVVIIIIAAASNAKGKKTAENNEQAVTQTVEEGTTTEETTTEETTTEETTPARTYGNWDIASLSSDRVACGFVRENVNEDNVPLGVLSFQEAYGEYNADFVEDTSKKVIYLTMDEGYANEETAEELDIYKEKGVNITFFCTMDFLENCPDLVQRMVDEGHAVGSHSATHPHMIELSQSEQEDEIMSVANVLKEDYDYEVRYFRFPYGEFNEQSLGIVDNLGLKSVFWSFAYDDYSEEQPDVQESLQLALSCVCPGAIFLLHAESSTNLAMLSDFIDGVREMGYEFGGPIPLD